MFFLRARRYTEESPIPIRRHASLGMQMRVRYLQQENDYVTYWRVLRKPVGPNAIAGLIVALLLSLRSTDKPGARPHIVNEHREGMPAFHILLCLDRRTGGTCYSLGYGSAEAFGSRLYTPAYLRRRADGGVRPK